MSERFLGGRTGASRSLRSAMWLTSTRLPAMAEGAAFISGQNLIVDGGSTIGDGN
ncbi:hypothetical protein [Pseudomonas putida]|uniref:hypothetical protein n=1 Tax=Pseudomonas putida TaxID=303 RepID=UPI0002DA3C96|nr:hypothetical protein [Pseudomonas putida]